MHYRKENRLIVYTDETCIHLSHTSSKGWYDDTVVGFKEPVAKVRRLVIVHAGGVLIRGGLLIFKSGRTFTCNYFCFNFALFITWFYIHSNNLQL